MIDPTPLVVFCHTARIHQHWVFAGLGQARKSSTGWFSGFKLHVVFNGHGAPLDFMLTPGNVHGIQVLSRLAKRLFGNKGYLYCCKLCEEQGYNSSPTSSPTEESAHRLGLTSCCYAGGSLSKRLLINRRSNTSITNSFFGLLVNLVCGVIAYRHQE